MPVVRHSSAQRGRRFERIDAGAESAKFIFDGLNVTRFCRLSTFRKFVNGRRRDQAARAPTSSAWCMNERVTLRDLLAAALQALVTMTDRGTVRGYAFHEARPLIRDLAALLEKYRSCTSQ
jgi:hypothetical protein